METPPPAILLKPRLRLRRSPSPRMQDNGTDTTPHPGPSSARIHFASIPDDEDELPTPRMPAKAIASPNGDPAPTSFPNLNAATGIPADTPAARLRALLAREPRSPRNTTPTAPPIPPSEVDSNDDFPRFGSDTSSLARDNLKSIFSRALREPGDTPQKTRPRRNSVDTSQVEITPILDRERAKHKGKRRSMSDEEAEKSRSTRQSDSSFRSSQAATFDTLRARLMSSQSQLMDQNLPTALFDPSTSTSTPDHHPHAPSMLSQLNPSPGTPPIATSTPQRSFQMPSAMAFQSNLLEQDSEMQQAMGNVLNSENEASTSTPDLTQPAASRPPLSSSGRSRKESETNSRRASHEFISPKASSSLSGANGADGKEHHSNHQREREWNRPRPQSRSGTPDIYHSHSQESHRRRSQEFHSPPHAKSLAHESVMSSSGSPRAMHGRLERRGSLASLRSFDDERSSRPSSMSSQADYQDRISELDRERNHERERDWNKRHPPPRPSSSLSTSSNHSFSHSHSHSHPPRPPSATPYLTPTLASLQRQSSRASLRSDSPTSSLASSHDSLKEQEEEGKEEVAHERERNWNSPHPKWSVSTYHGRGSGEQESISPSSLFKKNRSLGQGNNTLRTTSSLPQLGGSNGHQEATLRSTKLQSFLHRADSTPAASTVERHKLNDRSPPQLNGDDIVSESTPPNGPSSRKTPGTTSRFGWHFTRGQPLPPLEFDNSPDRRVQRQDEPRGHNRNISSPTLSPRPSSSGGAIKSSLIPVRHVTKSFSSVSHGASDMSLTHVVGDELSFKRSRYRGLTELSESVGPPRVPDDSWGQEDMVLASDEESITDFPPQSTTPRTDPPNRLPEEIETDAETEVLASPPSSPSRSTQSPIAAPIADETRLQRVLVSSSSRSRTPDLPPEPPALPVSSTPPDTPPPSFHSSSADMSQSFGLTTPPRQTSISSFVPSFRTPSPPRDLPELPGPPSSSDDEVLRVDGTPRNGRLTLDPNYTSMKTPKPPGAWAATPVPGKLDPRSASPAPAFASESTPLASTSTPLPSTTSYPGTGESATQGEPFTPVTRLSRANSLPLRTPAPPGAWMATPDQPAIQSNVADQSQFGSLGRRRSILKVRFDVTESEASTAEGQQDLPLSAIKLTNPEFPQSKLAVMEPEEEKARREVVVNGSAQPKTTPTAPPRPTTPERPTTPVSRDNAPSQRSLRRSPSVRVVDAYGRERVDEKAPAETVALIPDSHADAGRKISGSSRPAPPITPRSTGGGVVRIVDAMGKEVDDTFELADASEHGADRSFEGDVSVLSDDLPLGHADALVRIRQTLKDLAEGLSDADRSEDLELNSSHLEQLDEVSKTARLARNQLAQNLQIETVREHGLRRSRKSSVWVNGLLPEVTDGDRRSWNRTIVYCSVIVQLILVLAMWRYAHVEARRLFYTTYYDPLYPELTPLLGSSYSSGTLSTSRLWTVFDSYEMIRKEGWMSIRREVSRVLGHVGDQVWERWGEHVHFEKPT